MTLKTLLYALIAYLLVACQSQTSSSEMYRHIGQQIRAERLAQGISQQELADEVGMTQSSLSLIEDGLATPIHTKIIAIQKHLNLTFDLDGPYHTIEEYLEAAQAEAK